MLINEDPAFVFVELPQTATTAISKELREMYGAKKFLHKHATYHQYLKKASPQQKKYKSIGSMRNPLDQTVSFYFKYKSDKEFGEKYTVGANRRKNGTQLRLFLSRNKHKYRSRYIIKNNASFGDFFLKFYKLPFGNWSVLDHKKFDHIIWFENLAEDYKKVFTDVGLSVKRGLPVTNKTPEKEKVFWTYYNTDKLKKRAKFVFGPFMRYWGYEFPESWDYIKEPWYSQILYNILIIPSKFYWKYLM